MDMRSTAFSHRNLPRLLLQAREAVMGHTRPSLREHALSDQQWRVLRVLDRAVLARMERDGLIARSRDPEDQRRTVVEATARGHQLVTQLSTSIEAHYAWMEAAMGKQKLAQLYELLDELIALEQP